MLTDSDKPGRKAAQERSEAIVTAYPACVVRVVDFYPEREDGSDIDDWLEDGGTFADFCSLIDAAAPVVVPSSAEERRPEPSAKSRLNLVDLRDVRFERVEWFETNMIPLAELTLANGDGGIGKTTCLLDLVARSSAGKAMPSPSGLQHSRPMRWLIVAEEDRHGILRARLDLPAPTATIFGISNRSMRNEYT